MKIGSQNLQFIQFNRPEKATINDRKSYTLKFVKAVADMHWIINVREKDVSGQECLTRWYKYRPYLAVQYKGFLFT